MIDMVGIGPFVVMPFVVAQFNSGLVYLGLDLRRFYCT